MDDADVNSDLSENPVLTLLHLMLGSKQQLVCIMQETLLKSWLRLHRGMLAASW